MTTSQPRFVQSKAFAAYVDHKPILNGNDMIVLVMGGTGVGKSSFIETVTGGNTGVGHTLHSETAVVRVYSIPLRNEEGRNLVLVDTPGMNDTLRTNADVFETIAVWLAATYQEGIRLTGILYLHRASDNRVGGAAVASMRMFRKLCGSEALKNVVLLMTHADLVGQDLAERRQHELCTNPDFWQPLVAQGAQVAQYRNSMESALGVLDLLRSKKTTSLLVQQELVDYNKTPGESTAGKSIDGDLADMILEHEIFLKALKEEVALARKTNNRELLEQSRRDIERRENLKKDTEQQRKRLASRNTWKKIGDTIKKMLTFALR